MCIKIFSNSKLLKRHIKDFVFENLRILFKEILIICCVFLLVSCGEDTCYVDKTVSDDGTISSQNTMTVDVSTTDEEIDTGASVSYNTNATLNISGIVYMCNSSSKPPVDYATTCKNGTKTLCNNSCSEDSDSECATFYAKNCSGTKISDEDLCGSKEDSVCITTKKWMLLGEYADGSDGKKWVIITQGDQSYAQYDNTLYDDTKYDIYTDGNKQYVCLDSAEYSDKNKTYVCLDDSNNNSSQVVLSPSGNNKYINLQDNPCNEQVTCVNGTKQYTYTNQETGFTVYYPMGKCDSTSQTQDGLSYTSGINALSGQWTEIGSNIYNGDVLNFVINSPTDGTPNALSKNHGYSYQNTDNTTINRWTSHSGRYADSCTEAGCNKNCPDNLESTKLLSDYPNCSGTKQLIDSGYKMQSYDSKNQGLWNTFGKGLVLKGITSGNCPTDTTGCDGVNFNSTSNTDVYSNFGVLTNIVGESGAVEAAVRQFITKNEFSKICAKICDSDYADNLGGYTLNINRQSCIAINGHPSPCCPSKENKALNSSKGALMYRFGTSGSWKYVFTDVKYSAYDSSSNDSGAISSESITITNDNNLGGASNLYLKIEGASSKNTDTSGTYTVDISYTEMITSSSISSMIESIKNSMKNFIYGSSTDTNSPIQKYFSNMSGDIEFRKYITLVLILYIIFYGLAYLMGYVELSQKDLLVRILKIGVISALISDQSYSFFYDYFFQAFIDGSDELLRKTNFIDPSASNKYTFSFIDNIFALLIFNQATWLKVLGAFITLPFGIVLTVLFLLSIVWFLLGVMSAIVVYLICVLGVAILIFLAPIFIPFFLFKSTYYLFKNWCNQLFRFAIEPVMLVIGLQVLVAMFYAIFTTLIDYTVCWKCMFPINLASVISIKSFLDSINVTTEVFCIPFFGIHGVYGSKGASGLFSSIGISISNLMLLVLIAYLIKEYTKFISVMLDNFIGTRIAMLPGETSRSSGSAGSFVRSKLGIDKLEKWGGKKIRKGIKAATGFEYLTKEEYAKKQKKKDEIAKRQGMRSFGIDLSKNKFDTVMDYVSSQDYVQKLKEKGEALNAKDASKLGTEMFKTLAKDKITYNDFIKGVSSLQSMSVEEVDKLESSAPGIRDLHRVLNSSSVAGSFGDLKSKNEEMKENAMSRVGQSIFMNKSVSSTLLDAGKRRALSKQIFDLAHTPRSGIK